MRSTADRFFGRQEFRPFVFGAGRHQLPPLTMAYVVGGNLRVGNDNGPYIGIGQLARYCTKQVRKVRCTLKEPSVKIKILSIDVSMR